MPPRRSTVVALALAVTVLTAVAIVETLYLHYQPGLSDRIRVDWVSWFVALVLAYAGLGFVGWWAVARDGRACVAGK